MDDLISRQAAIETILECCPSDCDNEYECGYDDGLRKGVHKLKHLPSAQTERKKGKWIKMSDADGVYWACSECGEDIPRVSDFDPQFDLFPRLKSIEKTRFCPYCGARMEGFDNGKIH